MSVPTERRIQFTDSSVTTPRLRTTARRSVFWVVIAAILVILALVSLSTIGVQTSSGRLSATNPGLSGAEALIEVLKQDGVTVHAPRTLDAATKEASAAAGSTTVVLYDPTSILSAAQLENLTSVSRNLVLILPNQRELDAFAPGVSHAGVVPSTARADCGFRPVQRAGRVSGLSQGYRITTTTVDEQGCLGTDSVFSLVRVSNANQTVTVLGGTALLTNESIPLAGNAALALGLFGSTTHLVWYRPSFADTPGVTADGNLPNPPWVILAIILAALVLISAAVWRGRRFGALVVEAMPVTVRASETLEGRARLYQKASARTHALDALRIGTISRIAVVCGLPQTATIDEVLGAVAARTGRSVPSLRALLVEHEPSGDRELLRLSDELQKLENDVTDSLVPS